MIRKIKFRTFKKVFYRQVNRSLIKLDFENIYENGQCSAYIIELEAFLNPLA